MSTDDYILGTHDNEIARLALQHRVWRPRMLDAWRRAGITQGQTVIDLGCGPGDASRDLAEIVGPQGHVIAVDRSARFLEHLRSNCTANRISNVSPVESDVTALKWNQKPADALWCRWVFSWLQNPDGAMNGIHAALKPGSPAIFHEYLDYATWQLIPSDCHFDTFVNAVIDSTTKSGANINSATFLPAMLEHQGFEIVSLTPIVDVIAPSNFVWKWPAGFLRDYARTLVLTNQLTPEQADKALAALSKAELSASAHMVTPIVLEIIARRR